MEVATCAGVEADKADPAVVALRIVHGLVAEETIVFPDDASAGGGSVYPSDHYERDGLMPRSAPGRYIAGLSGVPSSQTLPVQMLPAAPESKLVTGP